jgi:DNA-binding SARP family transcriptional activator
MTTADPPFLLRLDGAPQLARGARTLALERKAAAALAWLALRGPVRRERLAQALWPQAGEDGARNNLRQLIFKLKKAMDAPPIEGSDELHLAAGVRLQAGAAGAPLLEGCDYPDCPDVADWLAQAREAQRRRESQARLAAAAAAEQQGDFDAAVLLARALVAEDPLSEAAHRQLVRALYLGGERGAALAAAQACEQVLQAQLDVEPAPETRELFVQLRQAAAGAPPRAAGATAIPVSVLRPPRMIGRATELAALRRAGAEGRVALVLGEPGLGKSRLLAEAAEGEGDAAALQVAARPGDAGVPYATLARVLRALLARCPQALDAAAPPLLRRLLPELEAADAPPSASRLSLHHTVAGLLRRAAAQGVAGLALDDLHFADEASLELLHMLIDEPPAERWRWTLAQRPAEGGAAARRLAQALAEDGRLEPLPLAPLSEAQVAELLQSLAVPGLDAAALAPGLARTTGGNPMFVLETLKSLLREGGDATALPRPRSVRALIERRLQQLSPAALQLARLAALAGPDFGTELAVQVLATPLMALADAWAELEAAQVLRDQAFAHDLIFEATLASVPEAIRRHARRAIAEFLEPREAEPARLAAHWLAAGEPARAAPHFVAAGRRAEAAARYAEARAQFEQAATCHAQAGQPRQALDTRLQLVDLLMEAGERSAALAMVEGLHARAGTVDERLLVVMQHMKVLARCARVPDAVQLGQRALQDEDLVDEATPWRLAELRHTLADMLLNNEASAEALAQLQLVEPQFAAAADAQRRGWFHSDHARALLQLGEVARADPACQAALAAAREVGRKRMVAGCLQMAGRVAEAGGRLLECIERLDEALLLMADAGRSDFSSAVESQRARTVLWLGRYEECIGPLERGLVDGEIPMPPLFRWAALAALAEAWAQLGQPARSAQRLQQLQAEAADGGATAQRILARLQAELAWLHGEAAAPALAALAALPPGHAQVQAQLQLLQWREQPSLLASAPLAAAREHWQAAGLGGHALVADVLAAQTARRRGDGAAALVLCERALAALRRTAPAGFYRPGLLLALAEAAGDMPVGTRALREAADWVQSVARFHVAEPFRDGFLQRNRINAEVLRRAVGAR